MHDGIVEVKDLGFVWDTLDPFLFCVHHDDAYPAGNGQLGPAAPLTGRDLGMDFEPRDGWRMYHGRAVPGFPAHPHRGFETVTLVRKGLIDHSDSLGAAARFGGGDCQWMTAGRGVVHSEMFPLTQTSAPNPLELFQIWLNLPAADKMVEPHFAMLWAGEIPTVRVVDDAGRGVNLTIVAGRYGERRAPAPPPASWASREENDVAIWAITVEAGATWALPSTGPGVDRMLYVFDGAPMRVAGRAVGAGKGLRLRQEAEVRLEGGDGPTQLLLLQGRPIGQPVVQHGPFVMNTGQQIREAIHDYQRTGFGGWPWPSDAPVHGADRGRFARHADGRIERP